MSKAGFTYPEYILQWIWNHGFFNTQYLTSVCGKSIEVLSPGVLNHSDGPDFLAATIRIDGITWHGSIEVHTEAKYWQQHGHHTNPSYNNVILHVVASDEYTPAITQSGEELITLNLLPHLSNSLHTFTEEFNQRSTFPCSSNLKYLNAEVLAKQIDKAHTEYLEKKVKDVLRFYDPQLLPSEAWKHALVRALFDGFGISHNREAMEEVGRHALHLSQEGCSGSTLKEYVMHFAFESEPAINWNRKGLRPAAYPEKRIPLALQFMQAILNAPFHTFLHADAIHLWNEWAKSLGIHQRAQIKILFATVYLPALYALASILHIHSLRTEVLATWNNYQAPISKSLYKKLSASLPEFKIHGRKLGAVHQIKHYCNQKRCMECFVLKKVIQS